MEKKKEFLDFATSLKLVRRAEVEIEGENIIDDIYTDLLPDNGILQQVNLARTSILKGRKGTGKSTIFQKSIEDMKKRRDVITIYIDVKTLYDSATPKLSQEVSSEISDEIRKYIIYKNFLFEVIKEANKSFQDTVQHQSFIEKMKIAVEGVEQYVADEFEEMKQNVNRVVQEVDAQLCTVISKSESAVSDEQASVNVSVSTTPSVGMEYSMGQETNYKNEFANTVLRYFDIKKCLIDSFLKIRDVLQVKYIYICIWMIILRWMKKRKRYLWIGLWHH